MIEALVAAVAAALKALVAEVGPDRAKAILDAEYEAARAAADALEDKRFPK